MAKESKIFEIKIAELKISCAPAILGSSGIGSCIVICFYDIEKKIGGLIHALLPDNNSNPGTSNPYRFVNTSIEIMLKELKRKGCKKEDLEAKVIGGANMFKVLCDEPGGIGAQNIAVAKETLEKAEIKIAADDTGGSVGRSVEFDLETGIVTVKTRI